MSQNTDNNTVAIIDQSNRRVLAGYPFTLDCGVLAENNLEPDEGGVVVTWYKDGTSLATGLSYTVDSPTEDDSGGYYFVAENGFGSTTSETVDVEIVTPGDDQFGINLVQNGYGQDGISSWTPQLGQFRINKFWWKSGDKAMFGPYSRYPNPGTVDPKYSHKEGLVYFTAVDQEYEQKTGDVRTFIRPNDGGPMTTCYQDVFLTDPDTIDIIDRKVEGVFDVEAKLFGWLGQTRSAKVYFRDWKWNGGWRTSQGSKKSAYDDTSENPADDYVETIREVQDESTLRYEIFDVNDELMKTFEMDSFRPTQTSNAMVCGYKSISLPPGTRRIRITMLFRRSNREHEWVSIRRCFGKVYRCGIHAVNFRIFINKDGLKFPSLRFDPTDVIDTGLQDQIEQQIMDSQMELTKCYNAIEDLGNLELKVGITKNYNHTSQTGTLQAALKYLANWARKEIGQYAHKGNYEGLPFPGLPGSDWYNQDKARIDNLSNTRTNLEPRSDISVSGKHADLDYKVMNGKFGITVQHCIRIINKSSGALFGNDYVYYTHLQGAARFAHKVNYYLHPDFSHTIETIIDAYYQSNMGSTAEPWWVTRFNELTLGAGRVALFYEICSGIEGNSGMENNDIPAKFKIAVSLASYDIPHHHYEPAYPKVLKWLFWRPIKAGESTQFLYGSANALTGAPPSSLYAGHYSFGSSYYYSTPFSNYGNWNHTIGALLGKGNYSVFNTNVYNEIEPMLSKQYMNKFTEAVLDAGNRRTYDAELQMSVREIYDSVYDGDYSSHIYEDRVIPYAAPSSLNFRHWVAPNEDDPDTWSTLTERGSFVDHYFDRLTDLTNEGNEFTYSQKNIGNNKMGFRYPCERTDDNPVSYYNGNNAEILIPVSAESAKIIYPNPPYNLWWRQSDLMYEMNKFTVMDYDVDDMVDRIDEIPPLKNFFECTRSPIIFNEQISMRSAPYLGTPTGNLSFSDANRNNSWHGYYSQYKWMTEGMLLSNRDPFLSLGATHFENHKQMCVPEFYQKSVLSGDTANMPADAPFRYQGANPIKCLTAYDNDEGFTNFSINAKNNLSLPEGAGSQSAKNRLDKLLRTYAMSIARADLLRQRIKFLRSELDDALDWVDTQGDLYGYDQTNTAVDEDYNTTGEE